MDTKPQQFSFLKLLYGGLCITLAYTAVIDKELQLVEGESLREQCNASSVPTVGDIHWQKENDTHFYENGTVLVLQNINRNDTGVYSCVSHDRKTGMNSTVEIVNIDVLYPPRPRDHTRFNVSAIYGQSAILVLVYEGNPSPSLTWYHEGQELPANFTGTVENKAGYVNLTNVDYGDYGNYTAVLNNSVGSCQAVYTVIPHGTPDSPTNLTVTNITSTTATLQWNFGFDWASPQYFKVYLYHKNDLVFPIKESERIPDTSSTHGIGANFTYTMAGLYPDTGYVMFVGAGNRWDIVGLSMSSGIAVRTKSGPVNSGSCLRRGGLTVNSFIATLFSLVLVTICCNH